MLTRPPRAAALALAAATALLAATVAPAQPDPQAVRAELTAAKVFLPRLTRDGKLQASIGPHLSLTTPPEHYLDRLPLAGPLGSVGFSEMPLTQRHGRTVAKCESVDRVAIRDCDADAAFVAAAARVKGLATLSVMWGTLDETHPAALPACPDLTFIMVLETPMTGRLFERLDAMPRLKQVNLNGCGLTDAAMAKVSWPAALEWVDVRATGVGDLAVRRLAGLPRLRVVSLNDTKVTDGCAATLAMLPALTHVHLPGTALTDAGLATLGGCKTLVHVDARRTKVTPAGVAAFRKRRPDVDLKADHKPN